MNGNIKLENYYLNYFERNILLIFFLILNNNMKVSNHKYLYEPKLLRSLEGNETGIMALDSESQGFISSLLNSLV